MQLRPHHIGIVVSDLERSVAFYEALGFTTALVIPSDDDSRIITFMRLGQMQIELFWYAQTPPSIQRSGKALGFLHFALQTGDVAGDLAELKAKGLVPADVQVRNVPPAFKLAFILDPDGVEVELMQEG
ncbi:MAG: VOC family protein [Coriobacteriia bacterium]|nr:VOC family protein [Coriobacteriia bacterium]MBN2823470.1 VOC family protein [Coriobacteriia bacterium]